MHMYMHKLIAFIQHSCLLMYKCNNTCTHCYITQMELICNICVADYKEVWKKLAFFDHRVVEYYSALYEEGSVSHINGVWPTISVIL